MPRGLAALTITVVASLRADRVHRLPLRLRLCRHPPSSDAPGDEGQSKEDACALIQESIEEAADEFESAPTDDPGAVVDSMKEAALRIAEIAGKITNDEVAAIVPALQAMFAEAGEVMEAVASGDVSQVDDLSELGTTFQETSEAFQEICAP